MSLPGIDYFGVETGNQNIVNFHCSFIYTNLTNIDVCLMFLTFQGVYVRGSTNVSCFIVQHLLKLQPRAQHTIRQANALLLHYGSCFKSILKTFWSFCFLSHYLKRLNESLDHWGLWSGLLAVSVWWVEVAKNEMDFKVWLYSWNFMELKS